MSKEDVKEIFKANNLLNKKENSFKSNKEKNWRIETFIRKDLPFLYREGIINPQKPRPSNQFIQEKLMQYICTHNLFDTPKHDFSNKGKTHWSQTYKYLHNHIHGI